MNKACDTVNLLKRILCVFTVLVVLAAAFACSELPSENNNVQSTSSLTQSVPTQSTTSGENELATTKDSHKEEPVITSSTENDEKAPITTQTASSEIGAITEVTTSEISPPKVPNADQQNAVNEIAEKYNAMGVSVALIDAGKVTDAFQYGWAVKDQRPMDENTKIRVASLSKVVLTMLAMQLYDEGRLEINAPLADYMGVSVVNPEYPDEVITVRHLLTHVSSLTSRSYVNTWKKITDRMSKSESYTDKKPGDPSSFEYNNYAYGVMGTVIDSISGMNLTQYAGQTLFNKLGVEGAFHSASMDADELAVIYLSDHTVGLSLEGYQKFTESDVLGAGSAYYAGGLTISAKDLARVVSVLCNDGMYGGTQVLSREAVELMETRYFHFHNASYDFDQGLTLRYQSGMYGRDGLYYHTGSNYGVYSFLSYDPETGSGIVVITTGAPKTKDKYDVYAICGEISDYFYNNVLE